MDVGEKIKVILLGLCTIISCTIVVSRQNSIARKNAKARHDTNMSKGNAKYAMPAHLCPVFPAPKLQTKKTI